jgi:hypothetical protein
MGTAARVIATRHRERLRGRLLADISPDEMSGGAPVRPCTRVMLLGKPADLRATAGVLTAPARAELGGDITGEEDVLSKKLLSRAACMSRFEHFAD